MSQTVTGVVVSILLLALVFAHQYCGGVHC
jgi:hypothetical protein